MRRAVRGWDVRLAPGPKADGVAHPRVGESG